MLPALGLCIWAGFWQLERGEEKQRLFREYDSVAEEEILAALVPESLASGYRYRRFMIRGRYDPDRQILLDSMMHDGQVGYQVLTPLLMGTTAVLVNRGWVAADPDRSVLPEITVDDQVRYVRGRLDLLPRPGIKTTAAKVPDDASWPRRLLYPTPEQIEQQLGLALYDYQLLLDAADPAGFTREWRPQVMGPERHIGYAVQWFSFAAALCIIFFIVNRKQDGTHD